MGVIKESMSIVTWRTIVRTILVMSIVLILNIILIKCMNSNIKKIREESERLNNMIKVTDEDTLDYCINSQVNEFLISGRAYVQGSVVTAELKGEYGAIVKTKYKYESHTETYTETYTDSDGKQQTRIKTRTVWEWENKGRSIYSTGRVKIYNKEFNMSNTSFDYQHIKFKDYASDNYKNKGIKDNDYYYESDDIRYGYDILPMEYDTTIVCNYKLIMIKGFKNQPIEKVIEIKDTTWINNTFYTIIIVITSIGVIILVYWERIFENIGFLCD